MVACYAINYIFFRIFFNYDFLKGAPVYVPRRIHMACSAAGTAWCSM